MRWIREKLEMVLPTTEVCPGVSFETSPEEMEIAAWPQPKTVLREAVLFVPESVRQVLPALVTTCERGAKRVTK